ncbi:MAG: toxin-antitoxin system YwqK family antitoxin [Bacteroidia bacterium]
MKRFTLILLFVVCRIGLAQSFSVNGKDTFNVVDANGKRQGAWVITGKLANIPEYSADAKVEEGKYLNSLKVGIWKHYFPNGNLQNKLTYENNRPNGYAIMYHENGKISEEGNWKYNKWVGDYKLYYDNGNIQQQFKFDDGGKRTGKQQYFYEDGKKMIEGDWNGGKEEGVVTEYYPNGQKKAEKFFNGGSLDTDPAKTKTYEMTGPAVVQPKEAPPVAPNISTTVDKNEKIQGGTDAAVAKAPVDLEHINGVATIYNKNRQKSKSGKFVNGKLIDGKVYIYSENGILQRIALFEGGIYKGDSPIEEQ